MDVQSKAVLVVSPNTAALGETRIPEPKRGEVLVRVHYSCISPGTEMRVMGGGPPESSAFPYIPGYSASGVVERTGPGCSVPVGTAVFVKGTTAASVRLTWGGHVEYAVLPESELYLLPHGMGMPEASTAHLVAISRRGLVVSEAVPGEKVAVIGLGPIGMLSAKLFHGAGCEVLGLDLFPWRVEMAKNAGVDSVVPSKPLAEHVEAKFGRGADIVVDATGLASVMSETLTCVRGKPWDEDPGLGGKVIVQGSYNGEVPIDYMKAFRGEMRFYFPRDCNATDIRASIGLLAEGRLCVSDMVRVVPVREAPQTYQSLLKREEGWMTAAFDWKS